MSGPHSVFVGNISGSAGEEDLRALFSQAGPIRAIRLAPAAAPQSQTLLSNTGHSA